MLLDALERDTLAERQVAAILKAAGADIPALPDMQEARERFDAALVDDGTGSEVDPEQAETLRALGLA